MVLEMQIEDLFLPNGPSYSRRTNTSDSQRDRQPQYRIGDLQSLPILLNRSATSSQGTTATQVRAYGIHREFEPHAW
jgi:hypothetical protein